MLALATSAAAEPPRTVVFVLLDTTRADRIGAWEYAGAETPVLDELARRGVVFLRHHANSHATRPSMPQLLSGRYYHRNVLAAFRTHEHPREYEFNRADPTTALLPAIVRAHGWATRGVSAHTWVVSDSELGRYFDSLDLVPFTPEEGHGDGADVVDRAIALWEAREPGRPLFLYLHFMDTHMPRPLPEGVAAPDTPAVDRFSPGGEPLFDRERRRWSRSDARDFTAEDRAYFSYLYDQRLHYADRQLGRLIARIERDDPGLRRTLVVVTGDHGEELGEDGRTDHTQSLADAVQHVPWIVTGASIEAGQRVTRVTEHVDVVPTLLAVLGLRPPRGVRFDGRAQLGADGRVCRTCGRTTALYAWEEYRAIRAGGHLLREERPGSPRARCLGPLLLYRVRDGHQTLVPSTGRAAGLARALHRRLVAQLDAPARAFDEGRWGSATTSVLVRPEFWALEDDVTLRCIPVDMHTPRGILREPGWIWTDRGVTWADGSEGTALPVRVRLPDGEYDVDMAAVVIRTPPLFFGWQRWLRKSFLPDRPGVFRPLERARVEDGWLRIALPAEAARGHHVVGLRATPAGATPRSFGSEGGGPASPDQLQRLRALGYVQ